MPDKLAEYAFKFIKPDIERIGLFIEMPYMNGKGYVSPFPKPRVDKGRGIMGEGSKSKNGTQHGYFESEFKRIYEGEGLKGKGGKYRGKIFKNVSKNPFRPAGCTKWHSTPGDYHGTFGGNIEYFSNERRPKPPYKKEKPNPVTSPGKKGGPGYAKICLSKYPEHKKDPWGLKLKVKDYGYQIGGPMLTAHCPQPCFDKNPYQDLKNKLGPTYAPPKEKPPNILEPGRIIPVGPAKWQGGCHAGCFEPFPEYKSDRIKKKKSQLKKTEEELKAFYPQAMGLMSLQTISVLNHNTDFRINVKNYKTYQPGYIKRLVN